MESLQNFALTRRGVMTKEQNRIRIRFVQQGIVSSQKKKDFSLENDKLSEILDCWKDEKDDYSIQLYINDILSANALIGATNTDRIFNLLTFLKTYWRKNPILLKDGRDFRKVITKHHIP